ncbi:MAG: VOC family protein [Nocardioidaceae bacterium]
MYDPSRGYPSVVPCLLYEDVPAAARWLCDTLGFREMVRATLPDGWVGHSELERDGFIVLLGRRTTSQTTSVSTTQVFVADLGTTCAVLVTTGGELVDVPVEQPWGVLQAVVVDPEGQRWVLTQHLRDTDPAEWFGQVFEPLLG